MANHKVNCLSAKFVGKFAFHHNCKRWQKIKTVKEFLLLQKQNNNSSQGAEPIYRAQALCPDCGHYFPCKSDNLFKIKPVEIK